MSWRVEIENSAKSDLRKLKKSGLTNQFDKVLAQLVSNPYEPNQNFEKLTPPGDGKYSRRINRQHRVVYTVDQSMKVVRIYSAFTHYA